MEWVSLDTGRVWSIPGVAYDVLGYEDERDCEGGRDEDPACKWYEEEGP